MTTKHEPPESPIRMQRRERTDDQERDRLLQDKPFDYIERTRPEDPSDHFGQQTRDNVNPHIPSVPPEAVGPAHARIPNPGGIVDPNTLGMDQSQQGVAPPVAQQQQDLTDEQKLALENHLPSINEPPGSDIVAGDAGPVDGSNIPPLTLTAIDPDRMPVQPASITEAGLRVTGTGFTPATVVLFDDEEVPTTFISPTRLDAVIPLTTTPGVFDVEVQRGDDLSDVLVFEIATAESGSGARTSKEPERKPKKDAPAAKRTKSKR